MAYPFRIANVLRYYVKRVKCKVNLGNKNVKIGIFTGGTSVRSKNIFTDISRYPTEKHEIMHVIVFVMMTAKHQRLHYAFSAFSNNPFPHDKLFDQTKLKAFADDILNVTKMIISVFDKVENIVGKGEIACTSNFSFSHNVSKRLLSKTRQKVSLWGKGLISHIKLDTR